MTAAFPAALPTIAANKSNELPKLDDHAGHHNQLAEELMAVQSVVRGREYNVLHYGLVADGTSGAANTTALQALVNSLPTIETAWSPIGRPVRCAVVRFPDAPTANGYYAFGGTITVPATKSVVFEGDGMGGPRLLYNGVLFSVTGGFHVVGFRNLTFDKARITWSVNNRWHHFARECAFDNCADFPITVSAGAVVFDIGYNWFTECVGAVDIQAQAGIVQSDLVDIHHNKFIRGRGVDVRNANNGVVWVRVNDFESRFAGAAHKPFLHILGQGGTYHGNRLGNERNDSRRIGSDGQMTATQDVITSASAPFRASDLGRAVYILDAGPLGASGLPSTIGPSGVTVTEVLSDTQVRISQAAEFSVTGKQFGVFLTYEDGVTTAASGVLTSASGPFAASMVGQWVVVKRAGPSDATTTAYYDALDGQPGGRWLVAQIASYQSATQVTLDTNATFSLTGATFDIYPAGTRPVGMPREAFVVGPLVTDSPSYSDSFIANTVLQDNELMVPSAYVGVASTGSNIDRNRCFGEFRAPINGWRMGDRHTTGEPFQYAYDDWYSGTEFGMNSQYNNHLFGTIPYRDRSKPLFRNGGAMFQKGWHESKKWLDDFSPDRATQNLVRGTTDWNPTYWLPNTDTTIAVGVGLGSGGVLGPDGLVTQVARITKTASTSSYVFCGSPGVVTDGSGYVVFSCFLRAGSLNRARLAVRDITSTPNRWLTSYNESLELGIHWVRHTVVASNVPANVALIAYILVGNGLDGGFAESTGDIFAWGPQLENGSTPTPYLPNPDPTIRAQRPWMAVQLGARVVTEGAAAPTSGRYERGDIVLNTAPAASGTIGWVCTAAGSPGTWKSWGAINA